MPIDKIAPPKEPTTEVKPTVAELPAELELTRHGKKVKLPLAKAIELAQQGFDYTEKSTELKAERDALRADAKRYEEYQVLRDHLDSDPNAAKAVAQALADPNAVLNPRPQPKGKQDDDYDFGDDEGGKPAGPVRDIEAHTEIQGLKAQVAALLKDNRKRNETEGRSAADSLVTSEIASYPWLVGKAAENAKSRIVAELERDPTQSPSAVTALVANEIRELLEEDQERRRVASEPRKKLRMEPPGRGIPLPIPPKKMDKKSLTDGTMLAAVKDAARHFGIPVD